MDLDTTRIPLAVRIELCRAAVQAVADRLDVRMLHIKGAALDTSIRAEVRDGSDVDVIVDPARVLVMHRALTRHGWQVYSTFDDGSPFGHAQTYWHPDWGYVDLHRRFPGISMPDASAFETLWRGHRPATAAGRSITVPAIDVQGVLFVLNAARGPESMRAEANSYLQSLTQHARSRLSELLAELDASVPAAVVDGTLGRWRGHRDHQLWTVISEGGTRAQEWFGRWRAARGLRAKLRVLARAPRVNRSQLAHRLGRTPTAKDLAVEVLGRGLRALREALPGARP